MKVGATFLLLALGLRAVAQEEPYQPFPCGTGNPKLKELLKGETLRQTIYLGCYGPGTSSLLSTSMLKSGGKPPQEPDYTGLNDEQKADKKEAYQRSYDAWTCQYSPGNLNDTDPTTAWAEGAPGDGVGEMVIVRTDLMRRLKIWAGYGKSQALFQQNARPKKIKLHVVRVKTEEPQCGTRIDEISTVAAWPPVTLRDLNGYQDLPPVPIKINESDGYQYWLGIEILEVYPGTKYKDLCISEVSYR